MPLPAAMSTHSFSPDVRKLESLYLGKKDRRSLEVASAVPWFWRKDRQSLPTFVSFIIGSAEALPIIGSAEALPIIGSAEALPILCVRYIR